ncbi:MAG: universal stress protein [Planctomycetaceae bacterium]|nr:universal stress protein [Planctomycetaceae bacterium]
MAHHLLRGSPAGTLLGFSNHSKIDLIVMGTHGRTDIARFVMGNVAGSVLRQSNCPLLTVKQPDQGPVSTSLSNIT